MKFTFTEKRMASSEELRAYATRKISKLDRLFKTEANAYVTFSVERGRFLAELPFRTTACFTGQANLQMTCMRPWIPAWLP